MTDLSDIRICVVGLGYVGLPLAVAFGRRYPTVGFDVNAARVDELKSGVDRTLEVDEEKLCSAKNLSLASDPDAAKECNFFVVSVPTPIDRCNRPDLSLILKASQTVGRILKRGDVVVYESTVYPGCTEEECVPVLERVSGLKFNEDFFCGYSPERINPGDKSHTVETIKKITSGSTDAAADLVDAVYAGVVDAGTYKASSIKVAEAAKVIENSQRDINIAFVNELSKIFRIMGIDTSEVLEAAGTKWNFLPFRPGLVGGHCIGVDPYYLTHKAQSLGYHPEIILAGRRLNDGMAIYVAGRVVKLMIAKGLPVRGARILVLGVTFKENCPDIRNSKVVDLIRELESFGCAVDVADPWADAADVRREYGLKLTETPRNLDGYSAVVLAVAHERFRDLAVSTDSRRVVFDLKGALPKSASDERL